MIKLAFSTVACPEKPLRDVAAMAESIGAQGVELRTFGSNSTHFACDPAMSDPGKVVRMFADAGTRICSLGTSCRFDAPVSPPIVGRLIGDVEKSVREAKFAIDLASELGASFVRVFGFERPDGATQASTDAMVVERLVKVCDHARHRAVKVVLENGGSYGTATSIAGIIDQVASPLLGACYNMSVAVEAGEDAAHGVNVLGDRLLMAKVKDFRGSLACPVGQGDMQCRESVKALLNARFGGWVVYEYDRAWLSQGNSGDGDGVVGAPSEMIRESFATMSRWIAEARQGAASRMFASA
ncbi:MAG TPA: sugar phosphate isomerase/epimerase family protein [Phycisphaerales bacterium]|nr:sugar phosphate isomerase/epimerase family protein [Phycisphaerales bacterium]